MFLSFIKKDSDELSFMAKVKNRYPNLPFDLVLGVCELYLKEGLGFLNTTYDDLSESIGKGSETVDIVKTMLQENLSSSVDYYTNYEFIINFKNYLVLKNNTPENLHYKFLIRFAYVLHSNENNPFKTKASDIVESITPFEVMKQKLIILDDLPRYISLKSDGENLHIIEFKTKEQLYIKILKAIIEDPDKERDHKVVYVDNFVDKNKPEEDAKPEETPKNEKSDDNESYDDDIPF